MIESLQNAEIGDYAVAAFDCNNMENVHISKKGD